MASDHREKSNRSAIAPTTGTFSVESGNGMGVSGKTLVANNARAVTRSGTAAPRHRGNEVRGDGTPEVMSHHGDAIDPRPIEEIENVVSLVRREHLVTNCAGLAAEAEQVGSEDVVVSFEQFGHPLPGGGGAGNAMKQHDAGHAPADQNSL